MLFRLSRRGGTLRPSGRAADLAPFPASSGGKDAQCRQEAGGKNAGYLKSGVVFMEIFQMPIKENSVAASPNNELMIFQ